MDKINSYNLMLEEKFLSFLNFEHTKPLAFFIKDYILFKINPSNLAISNFFLVSILDIISVLIYYRIILKITRLPKQSFLFASLLSISFVTWEYWRISSHFDHLNIFIFGLLIHSSFSLYQNKKSINKLYYFLSQLLILSFHSFGIIFSLTSILLICEFKIQKRLFLFALTSLVIYFILVSGNLTKYRIPLISTVGGQNQLQWIWSNNNAEREIITLVENDNDIPSWYKKCFNEAYKLNGRDGSIYGKCFPNPVEDPLSTKKYLKNYLNIFKDKKLEEYINKDLQVIDKNYHFSGGYPESKLNFSVYYGKFSGKLAKKVALRNPLITSYSIAKSIYSSLLGSAFFTGLHYEPLHIKVPLFHKFINYFISTLFFLGFCFSSIYLIIKIIRNILIKNLLYLDKENFLLNFSSVFSCLNLALYSITTCCENGRMMVGILPYTLIVIIYFLKTTKKTLISLQ